MPRQGKLDCKGRPGAEQRLGGRSPVLAPVAKSRLGSGARMC